MCFSAGASFGASAVLGILGSVSLAKARTPPQRLFASIPLVFAIQQLAEGMLWLSLREHHPIGGQTFFTYTFLVFAMMIWPLLIPLAVRLLETDSRRKKIMDVFVVIGAIVFLGIGFILCAYHVRPVANHHHIHYAFDLPPLIKRSIVVFSILYFIATIVTPFLSSISRLKWLGVSFLISYIAAEAFFNGFVISVWCFFAAWLSIVVIWILSSLRRNN